MAFDWISFLITMAIGIAGGLISGAATTIIGRIILKRQFNRQCEKLLVFRKNKECTHCKEKIPKNAAFCAHCGSPAAGDKECESCKIVLPNDALYCYKCQGRAIYKETTTDEPETEEVEDK